VPVAVRARSGKEASGPGISGKMGRMGAEPGRPDQDAVGLVVVTYQSARVLPGFLASLPAACAGLDVRVVAVDNASTDGGPDLVRASLPAAEVVELGANLGYAAGLNAGRRSLGAVGCVLVLNPDVRLRPGVVEALRDALSEPGVGVAVPRLVDGDGVLAPTLRREPTVLRALGEAVLGGSRAGRVSALGELVTDPAAYEAAGGADWATGAAMLISTSCWDALGGWDESFFLYSEETDFALRARDAGYRLRYVPDATAEHLGGEAKVNPGLHALLVRNRVRLFRKRHGRARTAAFAAAVVLNEALRAPRRAGSRRALGALLFGRELPGPGGRTGDRNSAVSR
jgi:N-acetylglucosaminyl-diphospho-decaprenol L-rhamnosyltransferase